MVDSKRVAHNEASDALRPCAAAAIGRGGILHHDFPDRVIADPGFEPVALPVSPAHLRAEGLGEAFVTYMRRWKGFVAE